MLLAEPKKAILHNQHNVIVQIVDLKDQKKRKKQLSQLFYGQPQGAKLANHGHSVSQNSNNNVLASSHQHNMSVGVPQQQISQMTHYQNNTSMNSLNSVQQPPKYSTNVLVHKPNQSFSKK